MFKHFLLLLFLFLPISRQVTHPDSDESAYLGWNISHAKSIALKSFKHGGESSGKAVGKGFLGSSSRMAVFWVTDPGAKAVARVTQLEERERDNRAVELRKELRKELRRRTPSTFAIVICTGSINALFPSGYVLPGRVEPERLAKIFLEDQKDKSRFVRAVDINTIPFSVEEIFGRRVWLLTDCFMLFFNRNMDDGAPLITDLKQKIRFHLATDSGVLTATFDLSDFHLKTAEDL